MCISPSVSVCLTLFLYFNVYLCSYVWFSEFMGGDLVPCVVQWLPLAVAHVTATPPHTHTQQNIESISVRRWLTHSHILPALA